MQIDSPALEPQRDRRRQARADLLEEVLLLRAMLAEVREGLRACEAAARCESYIAQLDARLDASKRMLHESRRRAAAQRLWPVGAQGEHRHAA
ncbi:MAG TPA: hypothetical protein VFG47_03550 [Geminicoccaceae bacterium]|nr:hypothetical protein [Geminicoccaceae bacterium]